VASHPPAHSEAWLAWDNAACGLVQTDGNGWFLRANSTFCRWVGYASEELIGKRKLQDLLTVGGRIFHQTHWAPLLQIQGSVSEVKLEVVCHDARTIPMVLNAVRTTSPAGVLHDIAAFVARDRDKYERELIQSRKKLEDMVAQTKRLHEEAKDRATFAEQMVGIVSHDLRNPLSAIQMATALLTRESLSRVQSQAAERIGRSTRRATRMISDLLDFTAARIGTGLKVRVVPFDLHATVTEAVEELMLAFSGRALRHSHIGTGECCGDADRLSQLIGNLVANAMAYGDKEGTVTVQSSIQPTSYSVSVHNDGPAIPDSVQSKLFEPMVRGVTEGESRRSVGLGLFIVRQIAEAHRGIVSVASTDITGTTFEATIPRSACPA
jgi:sigma-B regulation protein RsbU (phosphoserine phosphatase)